MDHSYCALQTQAIAQPFSLSLPGAMPGAPGIACAARTSTRTCEHWHRHLTTCRARWSFSVHVPSSRRTSSSLMSNNSTRRPPVPGAMPGAPGWLSGHGCVWDRGMGAGIAAPAPSEHAGARTTAVFWHCLCYCGGMFPYATLFKGHTNKNSYCENNSNTLISGSIK